MRLNRRMERAHSILVPDFMVFDIIKREKYVRKRKPLKREEMGMTLLSWVPGTTTLGPVSLSALTFVTRSILSHSFSSFILNWDDTHPVSIVGWIACCNPDYSYGRWQPPPTTSENSYFKTALRTFLLLIQISPWAHTSYLSQAPQAVPVKKRICLV